MDDPDSVAQMANAAVNILGKYLGELAGKTTDALIDKSANTAAGRLWNLVKKKFQGNDQARKELQALAAAPKDPRARALVEGSLTAELERDPEFATALSTHITQITNTGEALAVVNNFHGKVGKVAQIGKVIGDVNL